MTKLAMPKIDRKLIAKRADVIANLKKIIKTENILTHEDEIRPFETDALSAYKQKPLVVVFPENTGEVSKILAYCNEEIISSLDNNLITEAFGAGTAATIAPIKTIGYKNKKYNISQKSEKSISSTLLKTLNSIKYGESDDKFDWVYKLN